MLNVIDEFTHECLAIRVARKLKAIDVIDVLSDLFILRGVPGHIRSDNGPEFVAEAVKLGSPLSAPRLPISSGAVLGRMATSRASTPAFTAPINRASRIPTTNETAQCRLIVGFDPAPFCAAPMPNQKRRLPIAVSAVIGAALWRPYYAYDYGYPYSASAKSRDRGQEYPARRRRER
jgi:hypothetical protein